MTTDTLLEAALDEGLSVCACEDPFGVPGYAEDCPGHALHRQFIAVLNADNPLAGALLELAQMHVRHPAPGPVPGSTSACASCGGTGEVFHGWAFEGGPIFQGECGCDTPYCGGCGETWPCAEMRIIAEAAGVPLTEGAHA